MNQTQSQLALDLGQREAFGQEDFLVAPCNEEVVAWLDRWPDWPGHGLIIHGPAGCGKTHLAYVYQAISGARIVQAENVGKVDAYALSAHVVVEDVESGVDEQALLHLYNSAIERGGCVLITSRAPPSSWQLELPDLQSRLNALGSGVVGLPDDTLLAAILVKLLADRQLKVGKEIVTYLLRHMERSFRAARDIVSALDDTSLAVRREITVPLARQLLERHQDLERE